MAFALITPNGLVAQIADETFEVHVSLNWVDISAIVPPPEPGWTATHTIGGIWTFTPPAPAPGPAPTPSLGTADFTFLDTVWRFGVA
jgi:hypothetical protein